MRTAKSKGAVGLLLFDGPLDRSGGGPRAPAPEYGLREEDTPPEDRVPGLHISRDRLQKSIPGIDLTRLQELTDRGGGLPALPPLRGRIHLKRTSGGIPVEGRNVAGFVPSSGNRAGAIEGEVRLIVIGAHHDHLGALGPGAEGDGIFNGADDNASGTAGVLELAEYFSRTKPPAGLLFMTFSAEELGLFGSRIAVEALPWLREKTAVMINLDMIGRNPDVPVQLKVNGPDELLDMVEEGLPEGFDIIRHRRDGYVSDSYTFSEEGVPAISFFTGRHPDYHTPGDEADLLDYENMKRILLFAAELMNDFAAAPSVSGTPE